MGTTGKNRPCPCGSGKKYKLCCMTKEEKLADKNKHKIDIQIDNLFAGPRYGGGRSPDVVVCPHCGSADTAPDETPMVMAWLDEYYNNLYNRRWEIILKSINDFLNKYPDKVQLPGLEEDIIFELGDGLSGNEDIYPEYVKLLERVRREFRDLYHPPFQFHKPCALGKRASASRFRICA